MVYTYIPLRVVSGRQLIMKSLEFITKKVDY